LGCIAWQVNTQTVSYFPLESLNYFIPVAQIIVRQKYSSGSQLSEMSFFSFSSLFFFIQLYGDDSPLLVYEYLIW
jgi:hypothetical protein